MLDLKHTFSNEVQTIEQINTDIYKQDDLKIGFIRSYLFDSYDKKETIKRVTQYLGQAALTATQAVIDHQNTQRALYISAISIYKQYRRNGHFKHTMNSFIRQAQTIFKVDCLFLCACPMGDISKTQLIKTYMDLGLSITPDENTVLYKILKIEQDN